MIIDVATLTGAAIHALGRYTTAVVSNNDQFYETFMEATNVTDESFWRLPTFDSGSAALFAGRAVRPGPSGA